MWQSLLLIVFLLISVNLSEACNGYTVTLDDAKECSADSIVKLVGISSSLDKDCNVVINGCLDFKKPVKTAKGTYNISKPPLPALSGDMDFCDVLVNGGPLPQINEMVKLYGLPKKCPLEAKKYCINPKNNKINISAFKKKLGMGVGTVTVKLDADHDNGKTCIEFSFTLHKPRKG